MAIDTNRYRKRAADADQRLAFQMDSAADLSRAVGDIDATMRRQRDDVDERKRLAAKDATTADETAYQRGRDKVEDERRASEETRRTDIERERVTARDAAAKERGTKAAATSRQAARQSAIDKAAGIQGARGVNQSELEAIGSAAGMGPEELLTELDKINQAALGDSRKVVLDNARIAKEGALAEKARRGPAGKGPVTPEAIRMRDAKLREAEAKAKIAERDAGGGPKQSKAKELTAGEVEGVIELQGAKSLLNQLGTMKVDGDIDTGPIANAVDWFRSKIGVGDPKRVEFKALIGTQIAEYIKSISGATVSEPERASLLENVPTAGDNDDAFMAKLATVKRLIDSKLETKRRAYKATGRPTQIFDVGPQSSGDDEIDSLPDAD